LELKKPERVNKSFYVYNQCRDYLQDKYGYNERDYAKPLFGQEGWHKNWQERPQDFWYWVCKHYQITNGCFIVFTKDVLEEIKEDWVRTIYKFYLDEFGTNGILEMWVEW
jgi:hypothetical protein